MAVEVGVVDLAIGQQRQLVEDDQPQREGGGRQRVEQVPADGAAVDLAA
ncbi:MAG: hypothetical protein HOV78_16185, partial [Hamadaea sp.]|nr:hypothetical protein [Hamadaea sp.]